MMIAEVLIKLCKLVFGHPADELLKKHVLIVWGNPLCASLLQEFYFLESVHTIIILEFPNAKLSFSFVIPDPFLRFALLLKSMSSAQ